MQAEVAAMNREVLETIKKESEDRMRRELASALEIERQR
jgi:hypothetical protein